MGSIDEEDSLDFDKSNKPDKKPYSFNVDKRFKIIVAEDELINVQVLKQQIYGLGLIEQTNFSVNGVEAIGCATKTLLDAIKNIRDEKEIRPITLMLLDFNMPLKNGITVL